MIKIPNPSLSQQKQSHALTQIIGEEIIQAGGAINFARYMELALYYPELGYYTSSHPKFGKLGDFVTAPELSPLFAQSIARQCKQVLANFAEGDILEIGAGSGKLAAELLIELEKLEQLPKNYYIFEKSFALQTQQKHYLKEKCKHLLPRIIWLDTLSIKNKLIGIVLANEVLDAIPVHCFRIETSGIIEKSVTFKNGHFCWKITEPSSELAQHIHLIQQECQMPTGYESEVNLGIKPWLNPIANILEKGVVLLLDYGYGRREYYHPDRIEGTLMCFYQHQRNENPFQWTGLQDITAHVDFTAVIESAIDMDFSLGGYTTQSSFLLATGITEFALSSSSLTTADHYQQSQSIKKLTLPSQMGELIKVMALTRNYQESLLGFSLYDRRRSL